MQNLNKQKKLYSLSVGFIASPHTHSSYQITFILVENSLVYIIVGIPREKRVKFPIWQDTLQTKSFLTGKKVVLHLSFSLLSKLCFPRQPCNFLYKGTHRWKEGSSLSLPSYEISFSFRETCPSFRFSFMYMFYTCMNIYDLKMHIGQSEPAGPHQSALAF